MLIARTSCRLRTLVLRQSAGGDQPNGANRCFLRVCYRNAQWHEEPGGRWVLRITDADLANLD